MSEHKWWEWPSKKNNGLLPWYQILRRVLVYPIQILGISITFVGTLAGYGWDDACNFVKDNA